MPYHFRNLVFEGGGVKGIAYIGAMQVLEEKGILTSVQRVGGTSAGAINATLLALGYSNAANNQRGIRESGVLGEGSGRDRRFRHRRHRLLWGWSGSFPKR